MKYLVFLLLFLAAWTVIHWIFLEDRNAEGLVTFGDKVKDLGRHVHKSIGMVALILVILLVVRLLYHALVSP